MNSFPGALPPGSPGSSKQPVYGSFCLNSTDTPELSFRKTRCPLGAAVDPFAPVRARAANANRPFSSKRPNGVRMLDDVPKNSYRSSASPPGAF
jgi:hypothetical protein